MIRGGIVMLSVADVGRAVRFYVETLGMKLVREDQRGAVIDAGDGFEIGLQPADVRDRPPAAEASPVTMLHPKVPIDEAIAIYENRGITFRIDKTSTATLAHFQDPDANLLCLLQAV